MTIVVKPMTARQATIHGSQQPSTSAAYHVIRSTCSLRYTPVNISSGWRLGGQPGTIIVCCGASEAMQR